MSENSAGNSLVLTLPRNKNIIKFFKLRACCECRKNFKEHLAKVANFGDNDTRKYSNAAIEQYHFYCYKRGEKLMRWS